MSHTFRTGIESRRSGTIVSTGRVAGAAASGCFLWRGVVAVLLMVSLSGCQRPVVLMPTPVKFATGVVDPFAGIGDDLRRPALSVLYATNREVYFGKQLPVHSIFPSDTMRLGIAHFDVGDPGMTWEELERLSTSADESRRPALRLRQLDQMAEMRPGEAAGEAAGMPAFLDMVNRALAQSIRNEIVVYVHGANNAMHRGTGQAAQFRHFAGRNVVVLSFVWPSAERLRTYAMDLDHARQSQPMFARLIELLAEHTNARKIDVLAYSAGATAASGGLALLGKPRAGETREQQRERLRLGLIYYAAPDADTRGFVEDLKQYVDLAESVTVTANMGDATLRMAQRHQGTSRAGRPDPTELDEAQARFLIDASGSIGFELLMLDPAVIPGLSRPSHTYWQTDPWISSDMFTLFIRRWPARKRGLEPFEFTAGGRAWQFPPDYDRRIADLLRDSNG